MLFQMIRPCILLAIFSTVVSSQCSGGIPSAEVNGFLEVHNKLRSSISSGNYVAKGKKMPAAKIPIPNLTWNCTLEKSAQAVADTCVFEHSNSQYGENLFSFWSSGKVSIDGHGKYASEDWESEFQEFGWSDVTFTGSTIDEGIGHATQMAWAASTKIGCGIKVCEADNTVMVVCHYNPHGNYEGQNVYETTLQVTTDLVNTRMNQTIGMETMTNTTKTRSNSLLPLWITLGVLLFIVLLIIFMIVVLLLLRKKRILVYYKVVEFCPIIAKIFPPLSKNPDTKLIVSETKKKDDTKSLIKALDQIKKKPEGSITQQLKVIQDLVNLNCNVDYAAVAREKDAVKILFDVLQKNESKETFTSTVDCLTKIIPGSDEFKKIAKELDTLKTFDGFFYKYKTDSEIIEKLLNLLQLFIESPDCKDALIQSGIVHTLYDYLLKEELEKTFESTLTCLSGLSESITTKEDKLIERLFKRFIINSTVIEAEKNQKLINLTVKIIHDLTKNVERNKDETSKNFKGLFDHLRSQSNGLPTREFIAKILRNCISTSNARLNNFDFKNKIILAGFAEILNDFESLVINLNCLWIVTTIVVENEVARTELKGNRDSIQKDIASSLIECLKKYSIASEMNDERWEIIGKTFTAFKILDNDVLLQFKDGIAAGVRNLTGNSRFDADAVMRESVKEFIISTGEKDLEKIYVDWGESKKEVVARGEVTGESSIIEYWKSRRN